jgi:hypothetical protein
MFLAIVISQAIVHGDQRLHERLTHQIRRQLTVCDPHAQKRQDVAASRTVENRERLSVPIPRPAQQIPVTDVHLSAHSRR